MRALRLQTAREIVVGAGTTTMPSMISLDNV
jgi:hypothetical protein